MKTIIPKEIDSRLAGQAQRLVEMLLPEGKKTGREWKVGSVNGDSGQSCQVNLDGKGFIDFATGEGGDYIQLWMDTQDCDFPTAIEECKKWLGIDEPIRAKVYAKAEKTRTLRALTPTVFEYLKSRKLSETTISDFKVAEDTLFGKPAIFFPYLRDGELIHWKQMGVDRPGGKKQIMTSQKTEPCLFGWQTVPAVRMPYIIICEGEIDAMSWFEYGLWGLSVPFGGGGGEKQAWIEGEYSNLSRFDSILISMDSDEPGKIAAKELANRLGIDRCKLVNLPKKDINECLMAGVPKEEIYRCCEMARQMDIDEIKSPLAYQQSTYDWMFGDKTTRGFDTPWFKVNEIIRLGYSEISLWNGVNGHGKSEIVNQCALHAALMSGVPTMIYSPELRPELLMERVIIQCTGTNNITKEYFDEVFEKLNEKVWIAELKKGERAKTLLEVMEYAYRRFGMKLFIIDSLMKCGISDDDYNGQKDFVDSLADFKNRTGAHVMLVTHSRKGENEERPTGKMDVKGSSSITDLVDSVYIIFRNKAREKLQEQMYEAGIQYEELDDKQQKLFNSGGVYLKLVKNRIGGKEKDFKLYYDSRYRLFTEYEGQKIKSYVQHQLSEIVNG